MESKEFDVTLGGTEHLPFSANSLKFAASRSVEIAAMSECILRPSKTKLIFQCLPIHMRRRVMSHNAKRLPRNLRQGHLKQLKKSGFPSKQKRPSRKYRRRPGNLLDEYNRRQKRHAWLETHIWHAKRFHMIDRWGHRLAYAPCDKAFRACYRASSAHCLIQDISYYNPVQITGSETIIKELFSMISSCACGLSVCAKAYLDGKREGSIHLYGKKTYPYGYIGKIQFIWSITKSNKSLWLFVHPSQSKEVEALLNNFLCESNHVDSGESLEKRRKLSNKFSIGLEIKCLPGRFNRFRLTGPKSHAVLTNSLKCIDEINKIKDNKWISTLNHTDLNLNDKHNFWQSVTNVTSPSQLPPKMVVGLVVRDPRLCRPKHRTKAMNNDNLCNVQPILDISSSLSGSPLWDLSLHEVIKKEKLSNTQFIEHVTKTQLIPGEVNMNDPVLQSVPIVLVQNPGSQDSKWKKIGYGSGWDIIMPPDYSIQFWQTFIMFGARSGGLRESESLAFEMGQCYLPPDSNAGKEEELRLESELKEKYFRLPPSKRVNFIKLAIVSPFICPWKTLLKDWANVPIDNFFVLRDKAVLKEIEKCINEIKCLPKVEDANFCLIPIHLKMVKKGMLKRHAVICLMEDDDVKTLPVEPVRIDPNEKLRKQKRLEHKSNVKALRRKRSKLKQKGTMVTSKLKKSEKAEPSQYVKTMRELWLPSKVESLRYSCSRQILGCLTHAGFSFSESCSCGIGYIPYNALNTMLIRNTSKVLVRNVTSRQYRIGSISIVID